MFVLKYNEEIRKKLASQIDAILEKNPDVSRQHLCVACETSVGTIQKLKDLGYIKSEIPKSKTTTKSPWRKGMWGTLSGKQS